MKKAILIFLMFFIQHASVYADNSSMIPYKNIRNKTDIYYDADNDKWLTKFNKKDTEYFTKTQLNDSEIYYLNNNGEYAFKTECDLEFIKNGKFICYSNNDMKFYNLIYTNGELIQNTLSSDDVKKLFPNYRIIAISEFSPNTNSFKFKKKRITEKLILLNDTNRKFDDYEFSTGNAKFDTCNLKGFLSVSKNGMIQFSRFWKNSEEYPWYILLVR